MFVLAEVSTQEVSDQGLLISQLVCHAFQCLYFSVIHLCIEIENQVGRINGVFVDVDHHGLDLANISGRLRTGCKAKTALAEKSSQENYGNKDCLELSD